jgi:uncharacterized protein
MIRSNIYPIIRPSDAVAWSECIRRVWLDNKGELDHEQTEDAFDQLVKDRGLKHEQQVLKLLHEEYDVQEATSVEHTQLLIAQETEVIYQAQLKNDDEGFIGYPDFLIRSKSGEYQPADAKLSLSEKRSLFKYSLDFIENSLVSSFQPLCFLVMDQKLK